jgi:hypothetical protein
MNIRPMAGLVAASVFGFVLMSGTVGAAAIIVPGTSDPFLAGAPAGASVTFTTGDVDTAPAESPVGGFAVTAGETLQISNVTGAVSNGPCCALDPPTGGAPTSSFGFTATGFTERVAGFTNLPINSLVGVFYGPNPADPGVDQVFEIGNGGSFVVPVGATSFYLATVDSYQWNNNIGAFDLTLAVPEPATWAMMLLGVGMIGAGLRTNRRRNGMALAAA